MDCNIRYEPWLCVSNSYILYIMYTGCRRSRVHVVCHLGGARLAWMVRRAAPVRSTGRTPVRPSVNPHTHKCAPVCVDFPPWRCVAGCWLLGGWRWCLQNCNITISNTRTRGRSFPDTKRPTGIHIKSREESFHRSQRRRPVQRGVYR